MKRFAALAVLLIASNVMAADKWWDYYKRGTAAIARSDWTTVADQMSKSITLKGEEDLSARAARNEILVYVPHFWLGTARFNLGDVKAAIREWDISQSQGVVQKTQYYPDLRNYLARAKAQQAKGVAARSADARKAAEAALTKAIGSQVEAISGSGDRSETYRRANRLLQEASDQFNKAGNDANAYARAAETAAKSQEYFEAAAGEAASRKVAKVPPPARRLPQTPHPQTAVAVTSPPPQIVRPPPPVMTPPPTQVAAPPKTVATDVVEGRGPPENADSDKDLERVRSRLARFKQKMDEAASNGSADPGLSQFLRSRDAKVQQWMAALAEDPPQQKTDEIERALASLDRELARRLTRIASVTVTPVNASERYVPTATIRAELKKAYIAYASGELEESEAILTKIVVKDPRAAEAYLLRGVVRFTRLTLSGRKDSPMHEASADFRAALDRDGTLVLDPVYFSPKLIAFFGQIRQAGADR